MEEKFNDYNDYIEEDTQLKPPYYIVYYRNDYGVKHIATIKDFAYLEILQDRYIVDNYFLVPEE